LQGRCATCARFVRVIETIDQNGEVKRTGECLLGVWPSPLYETGTCGEWTQKGAFKAQLKKPEARAARTFGGRAVSNTAVSNITGGPRPISLPEDLLAMDADEFKHVLRTVIREELGVGAAPMALRWQGGEVVMIPGKEGTQEKRIPIESLFHKIVMVRDKLRVLEQKVNGHSKLTDEEKVQMQGYITACYGSLTTFNVLFQERTDGFIGQRSDD
jgi:hypothetical protein